MRLRARCVRYDRDAFAAICPITAKSSQSSYFNFDAVTFLQFSNPNASAEWPYIRKDPCGLCLELRALAQKLLPSNMLLWVCSALW